MNIVHATVYHFLCLDQVYLTPKKNETNNSFCILVINKMNIVVLLLYMLNFYKPKPACDVILK